MTEIVHREAPTTALAIQPSQEMFSDRQVAALAQLGMKDASKADLAVFFHHCKRTGLDPFARQIYMISRWSKDGPKQTIQVGIDGLRLIAQREAARSGETLSYEDTQWCGPDGAWSDVWLKPEPPAAAKVTVLRGAGRFSSTVHFNEVAQRVRDGGLTQMWRDKAALMVAKCAEAAALRKAYPQDLSGLYTAEEIGDTPAPQVQRESVTDVLTPTVQAAPPEDVQALLADGEASGMSAGEVARFAQDVLGRTLRGWQDLTAEDVTTVRDNIPTTENKES